ncbi:NupC/NupG family nucleoside CNT transporter [Desertifilum tharense IPPAS B-1220]|uniref:Nucleoside:proton symporter n=1 Tax=Desertifilum tharense IPPAS B-1220 TaxID=1781255 RepID=A0A1E5QDM9_9CYAN|nr:nucleoside transporter C-terminal domain-containing protein [Desertifilum tharense]MCD8486058.1 nucleoside:proton symporter [Desertifilum sp.]OEJ72768.1 nucleoside:proton symporter [Desertifilum tharense IPPAS B-1220]
MDWRLNIVSLLGMIGLCIVAWLGSENKRIIPWKVIIFGISIQLLIGLLVFVLPTRDLIAGLNNLLNAVLDASEAGARFLFTDLFVPNPNAPVAGLGTAGRWISRTLSDPYVPLPGERLGAGNLNPGYIFAFRALPQVIFFSGLISLLYRLNIIQPIVKVFAQVFRQLMNISGAESLAGAANIFVGIESAIAVKPFLMEMSRSELCAILTSCFGSIASTVLALYAGLLRPVFPAITGHLVSASIMTIPACFVISKLLVPETTVPKTLGKVPEEEMDPVMVRPSPVDSLIIGALDGVKMAVGIAAVLIAILGVVALIDIFFNNLSAWITGTFSGTGETSLLVQFFSAPLSNFLGVLFLPLTFLTGVSLEWQELWQSSVIIGRRLLETNIPPYLTLARLTESGALSDRALLIISYVLCGFTHIPSYGIFVGGLSSLVPERRSEISALGWKALWAGTLATLMTGCVAGLFDFGNAAILGR